MTKERSRVSYSREMREQVKQKGCALVTIQTESVAHEKDETQALVGAEQWRFIRWMSALVLSPELCGRENVRQFLRNQVDAMQDLVHEELKE